MIRFILSHLQKLIPKKREQMNQETQISILISVWLISLQTLRAKQIFEIFIH